MSEPILEDNASAVSSEDAIFDDIRPCRDDEAHQELAKIANDESLISGIVRLRYPRLRNWMGPILRWRVRAYIRQALSKINSIEDFQLQVAKAVEKMIATTTDGVAFKGFEKLDPKQGYLFMSNHRDISLDPALIDYALHSFHSDTVRIAIGDNLLRMPAATALMRLNKSFIVKRSVSSVREKLKEINHLSQYIGLSLKEGHSIWIAQREGRAKDGNDRTEEAVLKMLYMYGRSQKKSFAEYMSTLKIVPVSITYEFDPGDCDKARELDIRSRNNGNYKKGEFEDIQSIMNGIKCYKGRVSVVAGDPITASPDTPEELAQMIDNFIYTHYELYPSVMLAAHDLKLVDDAAIAHISSEDKNKFLSRIEAYPRELRERIMRMYAYPYINMENTKKGITTHVKSDSDDMDKVESEAGVEDAADSAAAAAATASGSNAS